MLTIRGREFIGKSVSFSFLVFPADYRDFRRWLSVPVLMQLTKDDPERAHELAIAFLESGLTPKDLGVDDERLAFEVCLLICTR